MQEVISSVPGGHGRDNPALEAAHHATGQRRDVPGQLVKPDNVKGRLPGQGTQELPAPAPQGRLPKGVTEGKPPVSPPTTPADPKATSNVRRDFVPQVCTLYPI